MALGHAILAALLDREYSGYQLAKIFDTGVANFWYALPQQLYAELTKLAGAGFITGRQVIQHGRPNKRVYTVTEAGMSELRRFAEAASKPSVIRDDLMVKIHAVDHTDPLRAIAALADRAEHAAAKIAIFNQTLERLRGELDEETFLRLGDRIGPYLTCQRGLRFEQENLDWCQRTANLLRARTATSTKD
jgi:DNA-binding PadR family transcriptional regulator